MAVGNVQEWPVQVTKCLNNYLRSYDDLKFTKRLPALIIITRIITQPTNTPPRPTKCYIIAAPERYGTLSTRD